MFGDIPKHGCCLTCCKLHDAMGSPKVVLKLLIIFHKPLIDEWLKTITNILRTGK